MEIPSTNLPVAVVALYRFARFGGFADYRQPLMDMTARLGIKGTLLLASEGINGTVAGPPSAIDELIAYLEAVQDIVGMEIKYRLKFADGPSVPGVIHNTIHSLGE